MTKPYPDPNITQPVEIMKYANTVTNGIISVMFTAACAIILFVLFKAKFYKTSDSVALAALLTLVIGTFLWVMGLIVGRVLVIYLLITIAASIWSIFEK
jgi:glucan phosphoethanolaminetransferase (alkaline phosphatase superfamily)